MSELSSSCPQNRQPPPTRQTHQPHRVCFTGKDYNGLRRQRINQSRRSSPVNPLMSASVVVLSPRPAPASRRRLVPARAGRRAARPHPTRRPCSVQRRQFSSLFQGRFVRERLLLAQSFWNRSKMWVVMNQGRTQLDTRRHRLVDQRSDHALDQRLGVPINVPSCRLRCQSVRLCDERRDYLLKASQNIRAS